MDFEAADTRFCRFGTGWSRREIKTRKTQRILIPFFLMFSLNACAYFLSKGTGAVMIRVPDRRQSDILIFPNAQECEDGFLVLRDEAILRHGKFEITDKVSGIKYDYSVPEFVLRECGNVLYKFGGYNEIKCGYQVFAEWRVDSRWDVYCDSDYTREFEQRDDLKSEPMFMPARTTKYVQ